MSVNHFLSTLNTYTWFFSHGFNPVNLSAVALTEDDARSKLLDLCSKISEKYSQIQPLVKRFNELIVEFYKHHQYDTTENANNAEREMLQKEIDEIRDEISSFTNDLTGPYTFHLEKLSTITNHDGVGVKEILMSPPTSITPFKLTTVFSALDG